MTREFIERYQGILADIAAIKADKALEITRRTEHGAVYQKG